MTSQSPSAAMIEAKHLTDRLANLHKDLVEMRKEVRDSLNQRVTHAEIGAFTQLMDLRLKNIEKLVDDLEEDFKDRANRIEQAHKEDVDGRKKIIYLLLAAFFTAIGTIIVQAIM